MKPTKEKIANNVRKICDKEKLSIEKLALNCDISARYMGSISRADCNTSVDMLDKLSKGTNYSVAELVSEESDTKYEYICVPLHKYIEYVGYTDTYGIKLLQNFNNTDFYCDDVSTDENFVAELVKILNRHQVSPVHAEDVIIDRLGIA